MKVAIVALLGISALLAVGNALQCHLCIGSLSSDCMVNTEAAAANTTCYNFDGVSGKVAVQNLSGMKKQLLDATREIVGQCITATSREKSSMSAIVERGCVYLDEDKDFCELLQSQRPEVDKCETCNTDYCNQTEL